MSAHDIYQFILAAFQLAAPVAGLLTTVYGYRAIKDWRIEVIGRKRIEIAEGLWGNAAQLVSWMEALRDPEALDQSKEVLSKLNLQTLECSTELMVHSERLKLYWDEAHAHNLSRWIHVLLSVRRRLERAYNSIENGYNTFIHDPDLRRHKNREDSVSLELGEALENIRQICIDCIATPPQVRKKK